MNILEFFSIAIICFSLEKAGTMLINQYNVRFGDLNDFPGERSSNHILRPRWDGVVLSPHLFYSPSTYSLDILTSGNRPCFDESVW